MLPQNAQTSLSKNNGFGTKKDSFAFVMQLAQIEERIGKRNLKAHTSVGNAESKFDR